jgi:hypothetical protein
MREKAFHNLLKTGLHGSILLFLTRPWDLDIGQGIGGHERIARGAKSSEEAPRNPFVVSGLS